MNVETTAFRHGIDDKVSLSFLSLAIRKILFDPPAKRSFIDFDIRHHFIRAESHHQQRASLLR